MGEALKQVALQLGAAVELIPGGEYHDFKNQLVGSFPHCDMLFMAAAVSDFEIEKPFDQKIKKQNGQSGLTLQFKNTADLLAQMGRLKQPHQTLVGFALETEAGLVHAKEKLKNKGCDWIVLNDPKTLGSDEISAQLIAKSGKVFKLGKTSKIHCAERVFETICRDLGLSQ